MGWPGNKFTIPCSIVICTYPHWIVQYIFTQKIETRLDFGWWPHQSPNLLIRVLQTGRKYGFDIDITML